MCGCQLCVISHVAQLSQPTAAESAAAHILMVLSGSCAAEARIWLLGCAATHSTAAQWPSPASLLLALPGICCTTCKCKPSMAGKCSQSNGGYIYKRVCMPRVALPRKAALTAKPGEVLCMGALTVAYCAGVLLGCGHMAQGTRCFPQQPTT